MRRLLLIVSLFWVVSCGSEPATAEKAVTPSAPVPAFFQTERDAYPLPQVMPAKLFSDPRHIRIYEIAERIPAVLAQQPCYCYCDRGHGHRSLLDCHRDSHSAYCQACRQEVILADRMNRMGLSAKEIRTAIIRGDWRAVVE